MGGEAIVAIVAVGYGHRDLLAGGEDADRGLVLLGRVDHASDAALDIGHGLLLHAC